MKLVDDYRDDFKARQMSVAGKARLYLHGILMRGPRKNMERMEEYVEGYEYDPQQNFISDSTWDHRRVMDHVARDVGEVLGGGDAVLAIDESGFAKKGTRSAGVARQHNGRAGKVDNCQVGVFAALSDGKAVALVDARLYLPGEWTADDARCKAAKIPGEERHPRTKPAIALEMVRNAVARKLDFKWVAADAAYGSACHSLLPEIDAMGLLFVADVRTNQRVYAEDPRPHVPKGVGGRPRTKPVACTDLWTIVDAFVEDGALQWEDVVVRDGAKGKLRVSASRRRVWLWDGEEESARCWWAVCTHDVKSGDTGFFLSNAPGSATLAELVRRHAARFWIERCLQDAKTSLGMADYQARGWIAWHHHMAMVMLAMLFMLRERRIHMVDVEFLSPQDIVELLDFYLPRRDMSLEGVLDNIARRHRKRQAAQESARRLEQQRHDASLAAYPK